MPQSSPVESSSGHTFHFLQPHGALDWFQSAIDAMDGWQVNPPGWDPSGRRYTDSACRDVRVCHGCGLWQVEYDADAYGPEFDGPDAEFPTMAAADLADDHRAECPAFDMLAGLAGIPSPTATSTAHEGVRTLG